MSTSPPSDSMQPQQPAVQPDPMTPSSVPRTGTNMNDGDTLLSLTLSEASGSVGEGFAVVKRRKDAQEKDSEHSEESPPLQAPLPTSVGTLPDFDLKHTRF